MSSPPSLDQGGNDPNLLADPPAPAPSNRRVLVRPPRPRYTQPASVTTPQVPYTNESSTQTSSVPDGVPARGNKASARRARQRAEEQLKPDHFYKIALVFLFLRRNAIDPTATNPWSEKEIDLLHGLMPFAERSDVADIVWRYGDQIKVVHDRIVRDNAARGQTIPDLFRGIFDAETVQKIEELYAR